MASPHAAIQRQWQALPLVTQAPRGDSDSGSDSAFHVGLDALQALRSAEAASLSSGVRVLGVWGPRHTGKRLFLRTLLNASAAAFDDDEASSADTLLWLWVPVDGVHDCVVLSGGSAREGESERGRRARLALLLLLASALVFCDDGELGARALATLDWLPDVARVLRVRGNQDEASVASDFKTHAPKFVWLVQNFKVKWLATGDGATLSPLEYLEKSLEDEPGFSDAVTARNASRLYFNSYFPVRECVALSRPLESAAAVAGPATDRDALRGPFVASVDQFYAAYLSPKSNSALPVKQLLGAALRADQLAAVLETYVAALNAGSLPTIAQAASALQQRSVADGFDAATRLYDDALAAVAAALDGSREPLSSSDVHVAHYRGAQRARIRINELSASLPEPLRRAALFRESLSAWEARASSSLAARVQQNEELSRAASVDRLARLLPPTPADKASALASLSRDAFPDGLTSLLAQYKVDLQEALAQYAAQASGPLVHHVLAQTLLESVHATTTQCGAVVLAQFRAHVASLAAEHDVLEQACDAAQTQASASAATAAEQKRAYEIRVEAATKALSDLRARLRGELNADKAALARLADELHMMLEAHARPESELSAATQSILTKERTFHEEERSLLTQQRDLMDRVAQLERAIALQTTAHVQRKLALETALARQTSDARTAHAEFARQFKAQTKRDAGALKLALATKRAAAEREMADVARESDEVRAKLALLSSPAHRAASSSKRNRDFFAAMALSLPAVPVLPPVSEELEEQSGDASKRAARAASFLDVSTSSATLGPNTATRVAARSDTELCKQS
ncbi:hypothetical protein PybrP1_011115 [[Pythium] brassicae (nom. inval.)]|nr:hypothetical protein PybrP1_011115 [[Pythium] brassicae (nom. inval.)]